MKPWIKRALLFGILFLIPTLAFVSIAGASSEKPPELAPPRALAMQEPTAWTLTVNIVPSGGGSVTQTPPLPNAGKYLSGTVVTLSATPNSGFQFSGWSGEGLSGTGSVQITMDSDKVVTATFTTVTVECYTLTINKNPSNGGNVTPNNPPDCDSGTKYTSGASVVLTASANPNFTFDSWAGCDSFSGTTCNVGMVTTRTVTANFVACYNLTTNVNPSGSGSVTVNTAPNCGTQQYKSGTSISLTASPSSGYVFSSWSGASGGANTFVTISGNLTVTANFTTSSPPPADTNTPEPTSTTEAIGPVATLTPALIGVAATPTLTPTPSSALPTTGSSPLTLVAIGLVLVLIVVGARYMRQSSA